MTSIIGIAITGSPTSMTVDRNFTHSFKLATSSASGNIDGIYLGNSSTIECRNNMIRIGLDSSGSSIAASYTITGINEVGTSTPSIYNNSVYIGGTVSSGSTNTFAVKTSTSNARAFTNNIFVNARSGGSGIHYAFYHSATTGLTSFTVNNNIYQATGTGGKLFRGGSNDYTTLRSWREYLVLVSAQGLDTNSVVVDPSFSNPTGTYTSVSLKIQNGSPAEQRGSSVGTVTDDFEGDTRSSNTPNDIGADAGNYTVSSTDIWQPNITYTALTHTRVWWRRSSPSASAWFHDGGVLASGNKNNGIWNFTLDFSGHSFTASPSDSIEYFIVAQDTITNNIWYTPFVGTSLSNPRTLTTSPTNRLEYFIYPAFSGNYSVGSGQTYTSLTATGSAGFFNAINNGALSGNVTVTIVSDITETGAVALNQWVESGVGNYTMTIISDGTLRTLSGSAISSVPMISINGADRVIIDGGANKLRLINTHTTPASGTSVVQYTNTATNDTIRGCDIQSNS
ncbi:MAG: hypothetical protein HYZ42_10485, partial [Bacteroidetes bacterium]|nr:hypothetical protein [Bacteroidota bacterium]